MDRIRRVEHAPRPPCSALNRPPRPLRAALPLCPPHMPQKVRPLSMRHCCAYLAQRGKRECPRCLEERHGLVSMGTAVRPSNAALSCLDSSTITPQLFASLGHHSHHWPSLREVGGDAAHDLSVAELGLLEDLLHGRVALNAIGSLEVVVTDVRPHRLDDFATGAAFKATHVRELRREILGRLSNAALQGVEQGAEQGAEQKKQKKQKISTQLPGQPKQRHSSKEGGVCIRRERMVRRMHTRMFPDKRPAPRAPRGTPILLQPPHTITSEPHRSPRPPTPKAGTGWDTPMALIVNL